MGHQADGNKAKSGAGKHNRIRRARLSIIRRVLSTIDYAGKDEDIVRQPDTLILGGTELIAGR